MKSRWEEPPHTIEIEIYGLKKQLPLEKAIVCAARKTLSSLPKNVRNPLQKTVTYTMAISFITPAEMQRINKTFRKKDKVTDVLSFSRLEGMQHPTPFPEVGDILICLAVAKKQAIEYKTTLTREVERLTVHGILHLFGYDHEKNQKEENRMFRLQERILKTLRSHLAK